MAAGAGIRTVNLCKVYTSPPPAASGAATLTLGPQRGPGLRNKKVEIQALAGLSLEVRPGEIFGLLGPNGAGKSTTAGILTTRIRPTSGEAWVGDYEVWRDQVKAKRLIGVVQQRPNLDFSLTAREILQFHAAYFGIGKAERNKLSSELLERFQLTDRADELVRGYSGGMMQRVAIARAMMHHPRVLFLDEPSTGLDPQTRLLLWEIIREYNAEGTTILLTTHNMEEADALCGRIAIIDHGKMIALGTPAELKASIPGGYLLRARLSLGADEAAGRLRNEAGVSEVQVTGGRLDIYADRGGALVGLLVSAASACGAELLDLEISEPSLENLFLHHTGRSLRQ
ncbi:MAG: ATP-binding cassette domain-containing protein [Bryobacterales bacterium]|nr:ATP-binding cassette domain-containing protein [Bryobacterales bacterium]